MLIGSMTPFLKSVFYIVTFIVGVNFVVQITAQEQIPLDTNAQPNHGSATFAAPSPDPLRISALEGGGPVDAIGRNLGLDCTGFIDVVPDFRITLTEAQPFLRFIFMADTLTADPTLIIRDPQGNFRCNNNSTGILNSQVTFEDAPSGDYVIWVGAFTPNVYIYGSLYITTNSLISAGASSLIIPLATATLTPLPNHLVTPTSISGTFLDASQPAAHGSAQLQAGFLPDPFWRVVMGGGALSVPALDAQRNSLEIGSFLPDTQCAGFTSSQPDFSLSWGGTSTRLNLLFRASTLENAALTVLAPDGSWHCNRDFAPGWFDPQVQIINPPVGTYAIWVNHETISNAPLIGVLYATERNISPEQISRADSLSIANVIGLEVNTPSAQQATLQDYTTEPINLGAHTGGGATTVTVDDDLLYNPFGMCTGYYTTQSTFSLNIPIPQAYLRLFFINALETGDPTLIVRMPDGHFYCSDDSYGTQNPTLNIIGNTSIGTAQVWIGNYSENEWVNGTLMLSRGDANPAQPNAGPVFVGLNIQNAAILVTPPLLNASDFIATSTPDPNIPDAFMALPTAVPYEGDIAPLVIPLLATAAPPNPIALDLFGIPNFGSAVLNTGYGRLDVQANGGGNIEASPLGFAIGTHCAGYLSTQPDFRLTLSQAGFLRIFFSSFGDSTLSVLGPNGRWYCSDDWNGTLNPLIDISDAQAGDYVIWIGSFEPNMAFQGTLTLSENTTFAP